MPISCNYIGTGRILVGAAVLADSVSTTTVLFQRPITKVFGSSHPIRLLTALATGRVIAPCHRRRCRRRCRLHRQLISPPRHQRSSRSQHRPLSRLRLPQWRRSLRPRPPQPRCRCPFQPRHRRRSQSRRQHLRRARRRRPSRAWRRQLRRV